MTWYNELASKSEECGIETVLKKLYVKLLLVFNKKCICNIKFIGHEATINSRCEHPVSS